MDDRLILTYSLLAHLKESSRNPTGSLIDIFVPIAKKGLSEYSKEHGLTEIKGKSFSEIQNKIKDVFGLEIPLPVLNVILRQIKHEINDEKIFSIYGDGAFIIKSYIFTELEAKIEEERDNIELLCDDYRRFCSLTGIKFDFNELQTFIFAQKIDLFSDKNSAYLNLDYNIPKYINLKFNDEKIFKIITSVYLGGIISSYLSLKITKKVTDTELLLDTNFFISLIDLNTEDSYNICYQLYSICKELGFRFSMLYSTVEQIKILLNSRIQDFASKELIGTVRCADVFNACIRRNIDKTQLERIKDSVPRLLNERSISIIHEPQIKDIVEKAVKSPTYKDLKGIRTSEISALNDAVAELYVKQKRGKYISEFSDVKCWFLHNSFNTFYFAQNSKIHDRISISANELLVLLWLSNPSQLNAEDNFNFAKGGLASYVTKYRRSKMPATETIKAIKERADKVLEQGEVEEKDIYKICVRMSEGHLTQEEAIELIDSSDKVFADKIIEYSKEESNNEETLLNAITEKDKLLSVKSNEIDELKSKIKNLTVDKNNQEKENTKIKSKLYDVEKNQYLSKRDISVKVELRKYRNSILWKSFFYLLFIILISVMWFINNLHTKIISGLVSTFIAFILFIVYPLISRFINHSTVLDGFKYIFSKSFRNELKLKEEKKYEEDNPIPQKL